MVKTIDEALPYKPVSFEKHHAQALKRLSAGEANGADQQMLLSFIINNLCGTYDLPYYPNSPRDTDFACGKQFVGKQIVKLLNLTPEQLRRLPNVNEPGTASEPAAKRPRKRPNAAAKSKRKPKSK